jgi:hypothetical protein
MSNLERQAKCQKIKLGQYFKHNIARYEKYTHKKRRNGNRAISSTVSSFERQNQIIKLRRYLLDPVFTKVN